MGIVSFGSRPAPAFEIFLQLKAIFMAIRSIDFKRLEVYEAGALLVTLLAYPGESEHEEERRSRVHTSLCACALRAIYEVDPDRAVSPQLIKPIYAFQTERNCSLGLRTLPRRLRHRMIAARMAYPFLKEAESGEAPKLPAPLRRLSLNAMAELVLEDAGHSDPENVETRIWRQSRPVIHLASAVHGYLQLVEAKTNGLGPFMTSRQVIEHVIRSAEYCESLIARSEGLRVDPERLIKIRLA
jgi:hypothetical protein